MCLLAWPYSLNYPKYISQIVCRSLDFDPRWIHAGFCWRGSNRYINGSLRSLAFFRYVKNDKNLSDQQIKTAFCLIFVFIFELFYLTYTFTGFIVFDTQMIMKRVSPEEYIVATIELYLDIINLFIEILKIIEKVNRKQTPDLSFDHKKTSLNKI